MAYCLTTSSHHLNQCWLIISEVYRQSPVSNFTGNAQDISIFDMSLKLLYSDYICWMILKRVDTNFKVYFSFLYLIWYMKLKFTLKGVIDLWEYPACWCCCSAAAAADDDDDWLIDDDWWDWLMIDWWRWLMMRLIDWWWDWLIDDWWMTTTTTTTASSHYLKQCLMLICHQLGRFTLFTWVEFCKEYFSHQSLKMIYLNLHPNLSQGPTSYPNYVVSCDLYTRHSTCLSWWYSCECKL